MPKAIIKQVAGSLNPIKYRYTNFNIEIPPDHAISDKAVVNIVEKAANSRYSWKGIVENAAEQIVKTTNNDKYVLRIGVQCIKTIKTVVRPLDDGDLIVVAITVTNENQQPSDPPVEEVVVLEP